MHAGGKGKPTVKRGEVMRNSKQQKESPEQVPSYPETAGRVSAEAEVGDGGGKGKRRKQSIKRDKR